LPLLQYTHKIDERKQKKKQNKINKKKSLVDYLWHAFLIASKHTHTHTHTHLMKESEKQKTQKK